MRVLFYISGHGFGHATRAIAIMDALIAKEPTIQVFARTQVPKALFGNLPSSLFHYCHVALDVGVVEKDIFSQDICATLTRYSQISASRDHIISDEVEFVKREGIDVIVSDIPPLASEVGYFAGIPTIATGNFSWDFIYEPYVHSYPPFAVLLDEIRASYQKTHLLLRLPFHHEMSAFPRKRDISLVARKRMVEPEETRLRIGIPASDPRSIVLVALRMCNIVPVRAIQELSETNQFIVLSFESLPFSAGGNIHVLGPRWQPYQFPDVVGISDVVISKLGYGIVSECIAGKTPLMYIPRDDFAEYEVLRSGMKKLLPSYLIPRGDFLEGRWYDHVKIFLSNRFDWSDVRTDGAEDAAEIILSCGT